MAVGQLAQSMMEDLGEKVDQLEETMTDMEISNVAVIVTIKGKQGDGVTATMLKSTYLNEAYDAQLGIIKMAELELMDL